MNRRLFASVSLLALVIALGSLALVRAAGQGQTAAGKATSAAKTPPRTAWGDPDLQGIWTGDDMIGVPLERRIAGEKEILDDEELGNREKELEKARRDDKADRKPLAPNETGNGPEHWYERGKRPSKRTSLVIDPPDGRIPPLTPDGKARADSRHERAYASWEDRNSWERCITRGLPSLMLPNAYNNNLQILQTPEYVAILHEMIHDARIVPLDGRPHIASHVRQWLGDSRGRWEGNTLVVDTTNFNDKVEIRHVTNLASVPSGSVGTQHVVERFTRVSADTIDYRATIEDPKTYTKPWTLLLELRKDDSQPQILEYGCHEGNYGMVNILTGARAKDKAASKK